MAKQEKIWYDKGDPVQEEAALDGEKGQDAAAQALLRDDLDLRHFPEIFTGDEAEDALHHDEPVRLRQLAGLGDGLVGDRVDDAVAGGGDVIGADLFLRRGDVDADEEAGDVFGHQALAAVAVELCGDKFTGFDDGEGV